MKSHIGATISLGKDSVYSTSTQQKLNIKNSTEEMLVGVDKNLIPMIIRTKYFLEANGYNVTDNIIYQENKSTMLLANNGRTFSGKQINHINI